MPIGVVPFVPKQDDDLLMDVVVNGQNYSTWRFSHADYRQVVVTRSLQDIPTVSKSSNRHIDNLFKIRNPRSPASAGMNADARQIGLGLYTMAIDTQLQAGPG
jgi:hypothetical protein